MEINRNNYEEYFLLYADNELTPTEKRVVEIFVQENVDLKEEFLMIQMTVNTPEKEMKLKDRSFLLKKETAFINDSNYEEIFVLYHDNEVSDEQKIEIEKYLIENANLKNDFELIGRAKIVTENSIMYPNKKELYRKENAGKVIPLVLWRSIAAAVFIGFGLWFSISYFNKTEKITPVASKINNTNQPATAQKNTLSERSLISEKEKDSSLAAVQKNEKYDKTSSDKKHFTEDKKEENIAKAKPELKIENTSTALESNSVKTPVEQPMIAVTEPVKSIPDLTNIKQNQPNKNQIARATNEIDPESKLPITQSVSYIPDVSSGDQNYVFYDVTTREFRKTKVGGFLKKVRRIVERSNPITRIFSGDEEQVAAK